MVKGSGSRDFRPLFFHDSNPSEPLINSLKYFRFCFRRDIRSQSDLRRVHYTAEIKKNCNILYFKTIHSWYMCSPYKPPRCASHRWDDHRGVHHTAEMISAVCITPQRQTAHRGDEIEIFSCLWLLLKGQSGEILLG